MIALIISFFLFGENYFGNKFIDNSVQSEIFSMSEKLGHPLVSVIIPTYNSEKYIIETITSAYNQTYPNLEIIIIDDGSTDNTEKILSPYIDRLLYCKITHSGLPAVARNYGIELAKGDFLAFLDSDDIWLPDKISKQMYIFLCNKEIGLVSTNAIRFPDKTDLNNFENYQNPYFHSDYYTGKFEFQDLLYDNFIITSSVLMKKELLKITGVFSEEKKLRAIEDYHLWLRISLITNIYYLNEPFVRYRERNNSIRSCDTLITHYQKMIWLLSNIQQLIRENHYDKIKNKIKIIMKIRFQKIFFLHEIFKLGLKKAFSKVFF